jgi:hypothetical protein
MNKDKIEKNRDKSVKSQCGSIEIKERWLFYFIYFFYYVVSSLINRNFAESTSTVAASFVPPQ